MEDTSSDVMSWWGAHSVPIDDPGEGKLGVNFEFISSRDEEPLRKLMNVLNKEALNVSL